MASKKYRVDSFHIGLGVVGDSAIHLVVEDVAEDARVPVIWAMLVDGGYKGGDEKIKNVISYLGTRKYDFSPVSDTTNPRLTFDIIMISHWDNDHYTGFLDVIAADLEETGTEMVTFLRYDDHNNPMTVFLCPEYNFRNTGPHFTSTGPRVPGTLLRAGFSWVGGSVDHICDMWIEPGNAEPNMTIIGCNLLTLKFPGGKPSSSPTASSPLALVQAQPPALPGQPGIYIVGACQRPMGLDQSADALFDARERSRIQNGVGVVDETGDGTPKNASSIACMIMWPQSAGAVPRISHYFAGDLHWNQEEKIINWTAITAADRSTPGHYVASVKLSHHGAKSSTPVSMLKKWGPLNLVASVGEKNGHPSWELLFYLDALTYTKDVNAFTKQPLLATMFPYFMVQHKDSSGNYVWFQLSDAGSNSMSVSILTDPTGPAQRAYREAIEDAYAALNLGGTPVENPWQAWDSVSAATPGKTFVRDRIDKAWKRLSPISAKSHPAFGMAKDSPNFVAATLDNVLGFYLIRSQDNENDGTLFSIHEKDLKAGSNPRMIRPDRRFIKPLWPKNYTVPADPAVLGKQPVIKMDIETDVPVSSPIAHNTRKRVAERAVIVPNSRQKRSSATGDPIEPTPLYDPTPGTDPNENDELADMFMPSTDDDRSFLPIPRQPVITPAPAVTEFTQPYTFIVASTVEFDSVPPEVKVLQATAPLNSVLAQFHVSGILLSVDSPTTAGTVPVHQQDELFLWLCTLFVPQRSSDASPSSDVIIMTADIDPANTSWITDLTMTIKYANNTMTYSTAAAASQLGISGTTPTPLGPAGSIPVQNAVVFGLSDVLASTTFSWDDISSPARARSAGLDYLSLLGILIGATGDTFHIDPSTNPAKPGRNCVWFDPVQSYQTIIRTQYVADAGLLSKLHEWLSIIGGLSLVDFYVVTRMSSTWHPSPQGLGATSEWDVMLHADCTLKLTTLDPIDLGVTFDFDTSDLTITLQFDEGAPKLTDLVTWVVSLLEGGESFDPSSLLSDTSKFNTPILRRLRLDISLGQDGSLTPGFKSASADIEVGVAFGSPGDGEDVVFLLTYAWNTGSGSSLQGALWTPSPDNLNVDRHLLPGYENFLQFEPVTPTPGVPWASYLELTNLIPKGASNETQITNMPDGLPTEVTVAVITIDKDQISFQAVVQCQPPIAGDVPKLFLSRLGLQASFTIESKIFSIAFDLRATMLPPMNSGLLPVEMTGAVAYSGGNWSLSAGLQETEMQGAHFLNFFDDASKADASALIQHIDILYITLTYNYEKKNASGGNAANDFTFTGAMAIGALELSITFTYRTQIGWNFSADLSAVGDQASTVGDIIDSIMGDGSAELPGFIDNIPVGGPGNPKDGLVHLELVSASASSGQDVILVLECKISPVRFTFLQYRNTSWADVRPSKRMLRVEATGLPDFPNLPLVGTLRLSETIRDIYFIYVQDNGDPTNPSAPRGLTMDEVKGFNDGVLMEYPLYYKTTKDLQGSDILLAEGWHFVVVVAADAQAAPVVLMDYTFGKPSTKEVPSPAEALRIHVAAKRRYGHNAMLRSQIRQRGERKQRRLGGNGLDQINLLHAPAATGDSSTQMQAFSKSIGPLKISNLGLKYANATLSFCIDASVALGPIALEMQGFSIDFVMTDHTLSDLPSPSLSLEGLGMAFDRAPLAIAGGLERMPVTNSDDFYCAGGVQVAFEQWLLEAAGAYGKMTDPSGTRFTTAFLFANLKGPLVTFAYASIEGLTGGFGYNNNLTLPTAADVPGFPLIALPDPPGNSTLDRLQSLLSSKWFTVQDDSFWVAAGLTVTAFQMLQVTAVAAVEWDPQVKIGIFAVALADVPSTLSDFKVAHVELGISAIIDFGKGIATFEGQLAPSSFVLDPSCHLSGGFALYYWFGDDTGSLQGSWVFSLGGYHSAYQVPAAYPNPPRLQIAWSLGPLSIVGQAYFAITPNVAMLGGSLHASLSIGVLDAWLDAYVDFILNYHPFSFAAEGGISVGVRFTLDLLFVTLHISVEISATLSLYGPPFHGSVYVDFWVFGFTIEFGDQTPPSTQAAKLLEFFNLVLQKSSPTASTSPPAPHILMCTSGMVTSPTEKSAAAKQLSRRALNATGEPPVVWCVHAGTFIFSVSTVFAASSVTINDGEVTSAPADASPIYSRPMHITQDDQNANSLQSTLQISIAATAGEDARVGEKASAAAGWSVGTSTSQVPRALWDPYVAEDDPQNGHTALLDTTSSPTIPLMMSVTLTPPPSILAPDVIPPFDAVSSSLQNIVPPPDPPGQAYFPDGTTSVNTLDIPDAPDSDVAKQYADVKRLWTTPTLLGGPAAATAAEWTKLFGWQTAVIGTAPDVLTDELVSLYNNAPLIGHQDTSVLVAAAA